MEGEVGDETMDEGGGHEGDHGGVLKLWVGRGTSEVESLVGANQSGRVIVSRWTRLTRNVKGHGIGGKLLICCKHSEPP